MSRTYELPMSRHYVDGWGLKEAVREILQNAIDKGDWSYAFDEVEGMDGVQLSVTNLNTTLPTNTLILGKTSKANDDGKIGQFGEGFKLALLVLCRMGYKVQILNGALCWEPVFEYSETFSDEVLKIVEQGYRANHTNLVFRIGNLTEEDVAEINDLCLFMQPPQEDAIQTAYGAILPSKQGFLYVGGLLVCETQLKFGYDVKPAHLKLDRDRQTVADWDMLWVTKNIWLGTKDFARIAEMLEAGVEDVRLIEHDCPGLLKEACYKQFQKEHKGKVPVRNQKEMEQAVAKGFKPVVVERAYYQSVTSHSGYSETREAMRELTPKEELDQWFAANSSQMRMPVKVAFKQILAKATKWNK